MKVSIILVMLLLLSLLLTPFIIQKFEIYPLTEPPFKTYNSDEMSFLKTFYLIEKGENYYLAFKHSRENFASGNYLQADVFTWRLPTAFYLWNICCETGHNILTFFIFMSFLLLILIYLIMQKIIGNWALLSPILFLPYLYDTLTYKTAFLFTEWWAVFFFFIGLFGLSRNLSYIAILAFTISILTREIFIVPISVMFLYTLFIRKNRRLFLIPIVIGLLFYFIHSQNIFSLIGSRGNFHFFDRFHDYKIENLQTMISFSMKAYVLAGLKTHYLFLGVGLISLLIGVFLKKDYLLNYIAISIFSFLITLPIIAVKENDYWGIMFVPLILMCIPLIFAVKKIE
jgi:hypothetical protein